MEQAGIRKSNDLLSLFHSMYLSPILSLTGVVVPLPGSFHLLHLMFDDYLLYVVETLHSQERAAELLRTIKGQASLG